MKSFLTVSLGCKVNSYECASLSEMFLKRGYVESEKDPSIVIINTCAVTQMSEHKSRQMINRYHKIYPQACIAVMGCYSQKEKENLLSLCHADILIGTSSRHLIPSLYEQFLVDHEQKVVLDNDIWKYDYEEFPSFSAPSRARAYIKIQDGCENFCSYCLIPFIRGRSRSRDIDNVLLEVEDIVKRGYKEIVLTGIDTASYNFTKGDKVYNFSMLLEEILKALPEEFSLRISSIETSQIDDLFLKLLDDERIANHLHIPLQSGSNAVLKAMNRKYENSEFAAKVQRIREIRPDIAITSDVIVGYPNEGEKEFEESYNFIKECNFMDLHVFPYSPRKGTRSSLLKDAVSASEKKRRVHELIELAKECHESYLSKFRGKKMKVIVEEFDEKRGMYHGHTSNYISVYFPSDEELFRSQFVEVTLDNIE